MQKFFDAVGREWFVEINVPAMRRVKLDTGKHLGELLRDGAALLEEITSDPILFADVLRSLVKNQITAAGLTAEQFDELLVGETAERAVDAFWESVVDFSPRQVRPALRNLAAKGEEVRTAAVKKLETALAVFLETDPESMIRTLSGTVSASPASSASTPGS